MVTATHVFASLRTPWRLDTASGTFCLLLPAVPAFPCSILGQVCWLFLSLLFSHMLW